MIPGKNRLVTDCAMAEPINAVQMRIIENILIA
jgi:hypothetical protein